MRDLQIVVEAKNSQSEFLEGIPISSPPSLAGKANSLRTNSLGGGLPVRAGMSSDCRD